MSMTLDEMKLAVCEKLPELVVMARFSKIPCWKYNLCTINWPTEGLQVCHEAEKLLGDLAGKYILILNDICERDNYEWRTMATHEQRLLALCRVWWPERFV